MDSATLVPLLKKLQKLVMQASLVIIYFVFFGLTAVLATIFNPRSLFGPKKDPLTFWKDAEDYEPTYRDCLRQS